MGLCREIFPERGGAEADDGVRYLAAHGATGNGLDSATLATKWRNGEIQLRLGFFVGTWPAARARRDEVFQTILASETPPFRLNLRDGDGFVVLELPVVAGEVVRITTGGGETRSLIWEKSATLDHTSYLAIQAWDLMWTFEAPPFRLPERTRPQRSGSDSVDFLAATFPAIGRSDSRIWVPVAEPCSGPFLEALRQQVAVAVGFADSVSALREGFTKSTFCR